MTEQSRAKQQPSQADLARYQRLTDVILRQSLDDWSGMLTDAGLPELGSQVKALRQPILSAKSAWQRQQQDTKPAASVDISALAAAIVSAWQAASSQTVSSSQQAAAPALTPEQAAILAAAALGSQQPDSQPAAAVSHKTDANSVKVVKLGQLGAGLYTLDKATKLYYWSASAKAGWQTSAPVVIGHSGVKTIQVWQTADASLSKPVVITSELVKSQLAVNSVTKSAADNYDDVVWSFQITPALGLVSGKIRVNVQLYERIA